MKCQCSISSFYSTACNVEEGTKYSGHNLFPLGAETQEECAAACLREPECHFWTHNPNVGKCWLKKSDLGRAPSTKGSNSGQKSCGVTGQGLVLDSVIQILSIEDDIRTGYIVEDGCACRQEGCQIILCTIVKHEPFLEHISFRDAPL